METATAIDKLQQRLHVLQCLHCNAILGDTSTLLRLHEELRLVVLQESQKTVMDRTVHNMSTDEAALDRFCCHFPVRCLKCREVVGRTYVSFRSGFDSSNMQDAICLEMDHIQNYELSYPAPNSPAAQMQLALPDAADQLAAFGRRLDDVDVDVMRLKHMSTVTTDALRAIEARLRDVESAGAGPAAAARHHPGAPRVSREVAELQKQQAALHVARGEDMKDVEEVPAPGAGRGRGGRGGGRGGKGGRGKGRGGKAQHGHGHPEEEDPAPGFDMQSPGERRQTRGTGVPATSEKPQTGKKRSRQDGAEAAKPRPNTRCASPAGAQASAWPTQAAAGEMPDAAVETPEPQAPAEVAC